MTDTARVAVLGATGYAGELSTRIVLGHPRMRLVHVGSDRLAGTAYAEAVPAFAGDCELILAPDTPEALLAAKPDAVILAKKSPDVTEIVPQLVAAGVRLVDIGTEFRLRELAAYERWYKGPHACPELLPSAVYGLSEWHTEAIIRAQVVGNPGCYATTMLLPLLPLVAQGLIALDQQLVCIGYSGVSGAGKRFLESNNNLFYALNENLHAYKALGHQHQAEVDQELSATAGEAVHLRFVPHLAPITRGILCTISCTLRPGVDQEQIDAAWRQAYADRRFIRIRPTTQAVEVANVTATNYCDFAGIVEDDCLIIHSATDNLIKGAAGQAVQNLNLQFGWDEGLGLVNRSI